MKNYRYIFIVVCLFVAVFSNAQPTFELKFEEVSNNGIEYIIDIYAAFSSSEQLGTSNLQFTFSNTTLDNPTLVNHNLTTPIYNVNVTKPTTDKASLNIDLQIANFGDIISVSPNWTKLARIKFDIIDNSGLGTLQWSYNGGSTETIVFIDDNTTQVYATSNGHLQNIMSAVLPVELCCFKGELNESNEVILSWKTITEKDNSHFNIQQSLDGQNFETIGQIEGQGTTIDITDYIFTDTTPFQGKNYYRLQQMDFNDPESSGEYSAIIQIEIAHDFNNGITIFPNPVSDVLNIDFNNYNGQRLIDITDIQGKNVRELTVQNNQIFVGDLPKAVYFLTIDKGVTMKFIKQ